MSAWGAFAIVLMVGAMTYSMRAVAIVALAKRTIAPPVERALRSVGPAVLAALAMNLAAGGQDGGVSIGVAEVGAMAATVAVAWWRRNMLWALAAGMTTLWLLTAIG